MHSADSTNVDGSPGPEKKGKMRKIEGSGERTEDDSVQPQTEKKPRKKWTMEETQMLVNGCNKVRCSHHQLVRRLRLCSQWGVGNWKSILNDPEFRFDNRSPVDLKDRYVSSLCLALESGPVATAGRLNSL